MTVSVGNHAVERWVLDVVNFPSSRCTIMFAIHLLCSAPVHHVHVICEWREFLASTFFIIYNIKEPSRRNKIRQWSELPVSVRADR